MPLVSVCAQNVTLYGSSMLGGPAPAGQPLEIEGASQPGQVTKNGLVLYGSDGKTVSVCLDFVSNLRANSLHHSGHNVLLEPGSKSMATESDEGKPVC